MVCVQDVHEIKLGADWQDALNIAVSNCEVFVPLVTPRYGETLWTNREVSRDVNTLSDRSLEGDMASDSVLGLTM